MKRHGISVKRHIFTGKGTLHLYFKFGTHGLKIEICCYLSCRFNLEYDFRHEVFVTVGGSEAIDLALRTMLDPGDEVIIPQPSYVSYLPCTTLTDGVPVL